METRTTKHIDMSKLMETLAKHLWHTLQLIFLLYFPHVFFADISPCFNPAARPYLFQDQEQGPQEKPEDVPW